MQKIRFGLIGAGLRGSQLARTLTTINEAKIVAVCDLNQSKRKTISEAVGALKITDNYNDLLSLDELDAVVIATPNHLHKMMAVDAFKAGKHVFCEKPMATTAGDCEEIIKTAEKTGRLLQIGLEIRYSTTYRNMKQIIEMGNIGEVQMIWCKEFRQPFPPSMSWVFQEKYSGGSLVEKNCHHFDVFNWFTESKPFSVYAIGEQKFVHKEGDIIDHAWVLIEYESGVKASLGICFFSPLHYREFGVVGNKGILRDYTPAKERTEANVVRDLGRGIIIPNLHVTYESEGYGMHTRHQLVDFIDCIKNNREPFANGIVGKESVLPAIAGEKSIKEKRSVKISEIL